MQVFTSIWLIIVIPGAFLVLTVVSYRVEVQFRDRLRSSHPKVWAELGQPPIFGFNWGRIIRYSHWFWFRGFDDLKDPELASLGSRVTGANLLAVAFVLLWLVSAWAGGYVNLR